MPELTKGGPTRAVPLGRDVLLAVAPRGLFFLPNDGGEISVGSPRGGAARFATIPTGQTPITRDDIVRYIAQAKADASTPGQKRTDELLDGTPFPENFPTVEEFLIGRDGSAWVRRVSRQRTSSADWVVVSPTGRDRCDVKLPTSVRLLDASATSLIGESVDADGEESLVIFRISRR